MAKDVPLPEWKTYLRWYLIHTLAPYVSSPFVKENFDFYGKTLSGTPEMRPRWQRVQSHLEEAMVQGVSQLYVEKTFNPQARQKALEMVDNLKAALRERIQKLDWMAEPTRQAALKKLEAVKVQVGYPEKWQDYSTLQVSRESHVLNVLAAGTFGSEFLLAKLGKPPVPGEWFEIPHAVDAGTSFERNEMQFPAGILQPPFFDPEADDACNYGAIGTIIGHELTHFFDDQGSRYDAEGSLKEWWTAEDRKSFAARQELFVKQFDSYKPLPDKAVSGKLTLGENIADLGGLKLAFAAFKKSMEGKPRPASLDGFTPEQRFFLSYAQAWHSLERPEFLRMRLDGDVHSPKRFRVIGPLSNLPEFFEAFGCADGSAMKRPAELRPSIW